MKDDIYKKLLKNKEEIRSFLPFFLAQKEEIYYALSNGFSRKEIWGLLKQEGKFNGGYETFCDYVSKHITHKKTSIPIEIEAMKTTPAPLAVESKSKENPKFKWTPNYDEKDLI